MWYFDNASTSYPKPHSVTEALAHFYDEPIGSYGRSSDAHTLDVMTEVEELRTALSRIALAPPGSEGNVVFTKNATEALNIVIRGLAPDKNSVLVSPMEHNAVTRPLHYLPSASDVHGEIRIMPHDNTGKVDLERLEELLKREGHSLRLICLNHVSNVNGVIQPLSGILSLAKKYAPEAETLVDTSQSLPHIPLDCEADYVAFNAHKGFRGIPGAGALFIRSRVDLPPLVRGGNGIRSIDQEDSSELPDRFESGTQNLPALFAWARALRELPPPHDDRRNFYAEVRAIPNVELFAESNLLFSLRMTSLSVSEFHYRLSEEHGILTRSGIHCAPMAHRTLGTLPEGLVRFSLPPHTEVEGYEAILTALFDLSKR